MARAQRPLRCGSTSALVTRQSRHHVVRKSSCRVSVLSSKARVWSPFWPNRGPDKDYPQTALFTLQPLDDQSLSTSRRVRIFHGFGDPSIAWQGHVYNVPREQVVEPK